ncbi:MAG: o-succinylbenzoate synthase [Verrucomicrobia bacterium]|nr:o-succinylbenzoate synthase [Verrucomicrobiota bacterium]
MKIEQIEIHHVRMPLIYPWRTAYGSDAAIEAVLLRMRSGGNEGWGESSPLAAPCYSPECAGGLFVVLRDWLAPRLIGQELRSGDELQDQLRIFKGNWFAKAALDTAWWDLQAQSVGQPLYRLLGGQRSLVDAGADFGMRDSIAELLELMGEAIRSGAPRVKLKYTRGWDLPVIEQAREAFPAAAIHIDCNSGYSLADASMFENLDRFNLAMFEQPLGFDDLNDHADLQRRVKTPVCLDESITSPDRARQAAALKSCRWVNIKPGRVGGLTQAVKIHNLLQAAAIPCWVGGMLESAVGAMHCAALATLPNFQYAADIFPSTRFYAEDLSEPPLAFSSPWKFTLPEKPGVGARPHPERLRELTVQRAVIG